MIHVLSVKYWPLRPALWFTVVVFILSLAGDTALAQALYQDNFDRSDSLNDNILGSAVGGTWTLNRDPDNGANPYNTNGAVGPNVGNLNNKLTINCGGPNAGAPTNNNDIAAFYVNYDLDTKKEYSVTFDYTHLSAHLFDAAQPGSQVNGGFFLLPRAQGEDFPGNLGYVIRRAANPGNTIAAYFYDGTGRSGDPLTTANIPLASLGTALDTSLVENLLTDQALSIRLDVYGPTGNLAKLIINGTAVDQDRDIGSNYSNATADHVMLGYNALGTAQRRVEATIDNLKVANIPVAVFGDYNDNGTVDAADYVVWRKAVETGATTLTNRDPTNSDVVGTGDYNSWRTNFGKPPGSGAAASTYAVPEPSAYALMLIALSCLRCVRKRTAI